MNYSQLLGDLCWFARVALRPTAEVRDHGRLLIEDLGGLAGHITGASWVVDGGMLQMGPQAGSHLTSDDWRKA